MRSLPLIAVAAILAAILAAPLAAPLAAAPATPQYGRYGFDTAGMDRSVTPGTDWGRFANGDYLDHLVIPDDKASYGMFNVLRDLSQTRTRGIVEAAATNRAATGEVRKIGDYYASFMDAAAIEAKGLAPLQPQLAQIAALTNRDALAAMLGDMTDYLQENADCALLMFDGKPVSISLPPRITMGIIATEPVVRGQTASSSYKPATLESGARVMVPAHIDVGTRIVVNTEDGAYVERAKA